MIQSNLKKFFFRNGKLQIFAVLTAVNVAVFLWCTASGEMLYNYGVLYGPSVWIDKEYYRFFSSLFLHADVTHLTSNMLYLYLLGQMVETRIGKIPFLIVYFGSGLGGGLLSLWYDGVTGVAKGTIGASGAIFGVTGALLFLVIWLKGRLGDLTTRKVLLLAFLSLYSGFTSDRIDNAAHAGGFLTGFLLMMVLSFAGYLWNLYGKSGDINEN